MAIPLLRNTEDTYLVAFDHRGSTHVRESDTLGHQWDIMGPDEPLYCGTSRQNNLQEPWAADFPQWHIIGYTAGSGASGIMRWNEAEQQYDVLISTDPNHEAYRAWIPNAAFFRGTGFFVWPFNQEVQLVSDGAGISGAVTKSIHMTLDGWQTARMVLDDTAGTIGLGDYRYFRHVQVCWQVVLTP